MTWLINSWVDHLTLSWINSKANGNHEIVTQKQKNSIFSCTKIWTMVPQNQKSVFLVFIQMLHSDFLKNIQLIGMAQLSFISVKIYNSLSSSSEVSIHQSSPQGPRCQTYVPYKALKWKLNLFFGHVCWVFLF